MKKKKQIGLDFVVDKLTNSIENVVTGDSFSTDISIISNSDLKNVTNSDEIIKNHLDNESINYYLDNLKIKIHFLE